MDVSKILCLTIYMKGVVGKQGEIMFDFHGYARKYAVK